MGKQKPKRVQSTTRSHLVFVSHATYDQWIAKVICEKLESPDVGAQTFRDDRDIDGGDSIPDTIMQAIRDCDEVVVLVTPHSVTRHWVSMEIAMAAILGKRIVPLLYHVTADELNALIRNNRAFMLNEISEYLAAVKARVQGK